LSKSFVDISTEPTLRNDVGTQGDCFSATPSPVFSPVQFSSPVPGVPLVKRMRTCVAFFLSIADNYIFCLLVIKSKMNSITQDKIDTTTKDDITGDCKFNVFELQLMTLFKR